MEINSKRIIPSFKGLTIETKDDGKKHHTFYSPGSGEIKLEVVKLALDKKTGDYKPVGEPVKDIAPQSTQDFLKLWTPKQHNLLNIDDPSVKLAYRFVDGEKPLLDEVRRVQVNGQEYNLAMDPERPDLKKPRSIYHLMPDMVGPSVDGKGNPAPDRRNHFNILGGTINDVIGRLEYIQGMGATRILSTPVFNNGPKNSNGYWTKNPYQVDPVRGNVSEFKTLQKELFKKGMGFIADGAFVNESWEGIHIKDIAKYGKDSPFFNWFFVHDPNKPINAPLLPDKNSAEAVKNVGLKIINGQYRLEYTEGKEKAKVIVNENHDPVLPTKIQVFDRRYVPVEKQNDNNLIERYDNTKFQNPNEPLDFYDSVQLASFEVDRNAVKKRLNSLNEVNPLEFAAGNELNWGKKFTIDHVRGAVSNIDPWDGQNDILKLRFFTTQTEENSLDEKELKPLRKASAQVQDNIVQVGEFWTAETEKTLSAYTAKQLSEKLGENRSAEAFKQAIDSLADEKLIPEESRQISLKNLENLLSGNYKMQAAPLPNNITEGLMSYPLEAVDFPDEVCSVLASPHIKKLAHRPELIGVSRYDLATKPEYKADRKEMSDVYEKMNGLYQDEISTLVSEIITGSDVLKEKVRIDNKGNLTEEKDKAIFRIISGDIMKFIVAKAIANTNPTAKSLETGEELEYDKKELYENSFKNWANRIQVNPEAEANSLVDTFAQGLKNYITEQDKKDLAQYLEKKVQGLDKDTLEVSKLILNKTESGLEWRIDAARDVAKMGDVIRELEKTKGKPRIANTFAENWDRARSFWGKFIGGVKKQNPKYYAIGESSNLHKVYPEDKNRGNYPNLGTVEQKFVETTGFTCPTNYTYLFSTLPNLVHNALDPAYVEGYDNLHDFLTGKLATGWGKDGEIWKSPGFFRSASADAVLYSHVGLGNHDTFRTLHGLSLDISEYNEGLRANNDRTKRWEGTKLGEQLKKFDDTHQKTNKINNEIAAIEYDVYKEALKPLKEQVFDKSAGNAKIYKDDWYRKKSEDEKIGWVINEWKGNQLSWLNDEGNDIHKAINKAKLWDRFTTLSAGIPKDIKPSKEQQEQLDELREKVAGAPKDSDKFKKDYSKPVIMADTLLNLYRESANELGIHKDDNTKRQTLDNTIKKAIADIATGEFLGKKYDNLPKHFGMRAVNHNWRDITAQAKHLDNSALQGVSQEQLDALGDRIYKKFVEPGMRKELALELFKAIIPGSPTLYNGQDTAETGFESNGKNETLQNRPRVHFEWLSKDKGKDFVRQFNGELRKITGLRKRPELSPLVNGQPVILKKIPDKDKLFALYRYNKERDVIAILNTTGFNNTRAGSKVEPQAIASLDTTRDGEFGVPGGLKAGTTYINSMNPNDKYVIGDNGHLYKHGGRMGDPIVVDQPALILYREKPFN